MSVEKLKAEVIKLYECPENQKRLAKWVEQNESWWDYARDQWHGLPRNIEELGGSVPISVYVLYSTWSKKLGFSLKEFYRNPVTYLKNYLRIQIERFKAFPDDTPITRKIRIWFGPVLATSLFGVKVKYYHHRDPIPDQTDPVLTKPSDLSDLQKPDFYSSGLMPRAREFYEEISKLAGDEFEVQFPPWFRSPYGVALLVRGYQTLLKDIIKRPAFVKDLLAYIADARMEWYRKRNNYLGTEDLIGDLFNDEIQCDMIKPDTYRELILPSEEKLNEFHDEIGYWHSCGAVHPIIHDIVENLDVRLLDIGPYSDKRVGITNAVKINNQPKLEIRFNPLEFIQPAKANKRKMKERIKEVLRICRDQDVDSFTFRVSGLQVQKSIENLWEKTNMWIDACREVSQEESI